VRRDHQRAHWSAHRNACIAARSTAASTTDSDSDPNPNRTAAQPQPAQRTNLTVASPAASSAIASAAPARPSAGKRLSKAEAEAGLQRVQQLLQQGMTPEVPPAPFNRSTCSLQTPRSATAS
jgi:hypothetical protein